MKRSRITTQRKKVLSITEIPDDMISDILSRLPLKSIFSCRCVCKTWCSLLLDPNFAALHYARAPQGVILHFVIQRDLYLEVESSGSRNSSRGSTSNAVVTKLNTKLEFPERMPHRLNSCNGLFLFIKFGFPITCSIYNPITGEYMILPQDKNDAFSQIGFGLGFSQKTNQFKVLRISFYTKILMQLKAEIHTVGTNSWRSIGGDVLPKLCCPSPQSIFLNGALHWMPETLLSSNLIDINSFDFENEEFQSIPLPAQFGVERITRTARLGLLGGCLCIYDTSFSPQLDIWMMKDYGVKESWTKQYVIETPEFSRSFHPVRILDNGEILFVKCVIGILAYNPREKKFRDVGVSWLPKENFLPIDFTSSFVSLKNAATGQHFQQNE
uniref:F-box domain-containing protein n=1 Tax=Davidia involucrata TaxID=16924 RepID=A0A5B7AXY7_DAVIN